MIARRKSIGVYHENSESVDIGAHCMTVDVVMARKMVVFCELFAQTQSRNMYRYLIAESTIANLALGDDNQLKVGDSSSCVILSVTACGLKTYSGFSENLKAIIKV
jgi:hypothetical protein